MRSAWRIAAYFAISVVGQLAAIFLALEFRQRWLMALMAPGFYAMRLLPNDPLTAGSFLRFPTLPQIILALSVNAALHVAIALALRRFTQRRAP